MSAQTALAVVDGAGVLVRPGEAGPVAWWSLTKTAIAALALRLADDGRLDLDAPEPGRPFTLRQLLRHTAGLPDYGALPDYKRAVQAGEAPWTDAELLDRVEAHRLLFAPGDGWRYSNVGYLLARRRLEERTGLPLARALDRFVLQPLDLPGTRLAETPDDMARLLLPPPHPYHPGWVFHGTLIGRVAEAALFVDRLLRPGFLSAQGLSALRLPQPVPDPAAGPPWRAPCYGTGAMIGEWDMGARPHATVLGHGAGGPGSQGATFRIARHGRAATVSVYTARAEPGAEIDARKAARPHLRRRRGPSSGA